MSITDPDYLTDQFYKGDTVYWLHHNGQGDDPRREGVLLAINGGEAWVNEKHSGKVTVAVKALSHDQESAWGEL